MSDQAAYHVPTGELALSGPVEKPAPGTLPLRGDVAHIALASRFLVPHYVVPQLRRIGAEPVALRLTASQDAAALVQLGAGAEVEALDFAGDWCWCCLGPDGPSGYVPIAALAPTEL
ncbi:MAG: hypothetical protein IE933_08550 [Sphingomonadales bacterium]|nr:hypothetical protein [Sphingomonadales bacterium]MBD3773600.1 hypothetical protein [Paracoccaceae bacterium]